MRLAANYEPREPQIVTVSSVIVSSAAIKIQARRVALHTIFKANAELRNDFRVKKFTVYEVGYVGFCCKGKSIYFLTMSSWASKSKSVFLFLGFILAW